MSSLLAVDLAILPPSDVSQRAVDASARLPDRESLGLRLDGEHLPHVTLTQQFVRVDDLDAVLTQVGGRLQGQPPLTLRITGGGQGHRSVWMAIERSAELVSLHERLMDALEPFERAGEDPAAFLGGDARPEDLAWVSGYRLKSSFRAFAPHITLGHAHEPPRITPATFVATTVAACHLGRFCTCRRVLRRWELAAN